MGPNGLQNFPVITVAEAGSSTHIVGSLNSLANTNFTLHFYANTTADPSGYGEGERYLGATTVTTNGSGDASFDLLIPTSTALGEYVTATATGPEGTSEFSALELVEAAPLITLSGRVFDDLQNNGMYDGGDAGIAAVHVELFDQTTNVLVATAVTDVDGAYEFSDLMPGTYKLVETQPEGVLDGKETAGDLNNGTVDNSQDSNEIRDIVLQAGDPDAIGYDFAELRPAEIQGLVWEDFNNDGEVNFGEKAVEGVTITLSGTDDRGAAVSLNTQTDIEGIYMFIDLRPGEYTVAEVQPNELNDGVDVVGTIDGVPVGDNSVNDVISSITISTPGTEAQNYNFAERPPAGGVVTAGQTATIGYWQNNNGQELIKSLNGGAASTELANWLASSFPNMYGASAGPKDLTDASNDDVADFYSDLFRRKKREAEQMGLGGPTKVDAQIMAVAFATYVTNETLAGNSAASYGFLVTQEGVGVATFNVGDAGDAFGVADHTDMTVLDMLFATNARSTNGVLYDLDGDGDADDESETLLRTLANDVYAAINEFGDI